MKIPQKLKLDCAVPDCINLATTTARISINNLPKKRLPCCDMHADAAKEDWVPVVTKTNGVVHIDQIKALDDLKKLNGLPPYDGFNPCCGDGYFALAMTKEYGMSIEELEKAVDFKKLTEQWRAIRDRFISKNS